MKFNILLLAAAVGAASMAVEARASLVTEVAFQSVYVFESPGGYDTPAVYDGSEISNWYFYTRDDTNDGLVDVLSLRGEAPTGWGSTDWWNFDFTTRGLNQTLAAGTYPDPERYPFDGPGKSGFSAGITGVALDPSFPNAKSSFKILDFQYDYAAPGSITPNVADNRVKSFAAEFDIHADYNDVKNVNVLKGHVYYNYDKDPIPQPTVPEPSTLLLVGGGLAGMFARRKKRS